jgi:anti-sigma regulatory factor (Ser/Thr protein kinase)
VTTASDHAQARPSAHYAFFYKNWDQYADVVCSCIAKGLTAGEPAAVAIPGDRLDLVRDALGEAGNAVSFADMADLGRNPARIIPAILRFAASRSPGRTRFVGEPMWPGRTPAETVEAILHEALINTALAGGPTTLLCPYDTSELGGAVLEYAWRTHPRALEDGPPRTSPRYSGPRVARAIGEQPLPGPPPGAQKTVFRRQDLPALREWVNRRARQEGLADAQALDLVIAVNEIATNTVVHAQGPGILRIWRDATTLICEVCDNGRIDDPLAGRRPPPPGSAGGQGLLVVNQLCDLVQQRSGPWGTTTRLHILCG